MNLSVKIFAVGTLIVVASAVAMAALSAETYTALRSFNPLAALAAVAAGIAGLVWFKKTSK